MNLTARQVSTGKTGTDFHTLDGLNGHHSRCQSGVQPAVPLNMRPQSHRHTTDDNFKGSSQRIAVLFRLVNFSFHGLFSLAVIAVQLRANILTDLCPVNLGTVHLHTADIDHLRNHCYPQFTQKFLAHSPHSHTHSRFPGTGAFQNIAYIVAVILLHAGQIRMTGTGCRYLFPLRFAKSGHTSQPVGKILVNDLQGNRAADGFVKPHPGKHFHLIRFYFHASAPAVALLTTGQVPVDIFLMQPQSCR